MRLIGLAGQLASGKDSLADCMIPMLNKMADDKWHRAAFADAVKEVYQSSFGVDRKFIEDWKRNPEPPPGMLKNVRQGLQFIGDGFRQIKDGIWIEIALRDENKKVISDSRYINEAKAIKAKGGLMILMYRPGFLNDDPNPSEAQIKPLIEYCIANFVEGPIPKKLPADCPEAMRHYDYFFVNGGSLGDLCQKIENSLIPYILVRSDLTLH